MAYAFLLYFTLLMGLFYLEAALFGPETLNDRGGDLRIVLLEDLLDACVFSAVPILFVVKVYGASLTAIGFVARGFWRNVLLGAATGILLWALASLADPLVKEVFGPGPPHPYVEVWKRAEGVWAQGLLLISAALLTPAAEEVYFRGFAYTVFRHRYGRWFGISGSSLLFAAVHLNITWAVPILGMGIILCLVFERTGSLVSVICAHSIVNVLSLTLGGL